MSAEFHIGIDDTDSENGGCTTYTAAVLFQELSKSGIRPSDFPWLVRLNPNIPWKTRGNGALSIHLIVDEEDIEGVRTLTMHTVRATAELSGRRTDPAIVFLWGNVPEILREYSTSALHDVLSVNYARLVAKKAGVETCLLRGTRGLIGALAAVGAGLDHTDHTFELIAYRTREKLGTPRLVNIESIKMMNSRHGDATFHNLDPESDRILICPHGPDPVLLGIRGFSPDGVRKAFSEVRIDEPVERIMIFRTNQGTDAHLTKARSIVDLKPYQSAILVGRVDTVPRVQRGGHVIFCLRDGTGPIDCAVYSPTGSLNTAVRDLLPGDRVKVFGGIRTHGHGRLTLNVEKIDILDLIDNIRRENPICQSCGGRYESMGRGQGFRCKKCGIRNGTVIPISRHLRRTIEPTTYRPAVGARRHLTRPTQDFLNEILISRRSFC